MAAKLASNGPLVSGSEISILLMVLIRLIGFPAVSPLKPSSALLSPGIDFIEQTKSSSLDLEPVIPIHLNRWPVSSYYRGFPVVGIAPSGMAEIPIA